MKAPGRVQICAGKVGERGLRGMAGEAGTPGGGVTSMWESEGDQTPPHVGMYGCGRCVRMEMEREG